jgi:hypothetical protein
MFIEFSSVLAAGPGLRHTSIIRPYNPVALLLYPHCMERNHYPLRMHPMSLTLELADQTRCMFAMQVCHELPNPVPHGKVPEGFPESPQRCSVHPGTPPGGHGTSQV